MVDATVLLPTTGERGPLIRHALDSVLTQVGVQIEVFVIGDGAGESTREVVAELAARDSRLRFFDRPKGERRGETYRHELLTRHARGRIVCYLCDRDLWCRDHVATLADALRENDFALVLTLVARPEGRLVAGPPQLDLCTAAHRRALLEGGWYAALPLSAAGHTLAAYRRLPSGWATTPEHKLTDMYMWRKFLRERKCRPTVVPVPTVLWFPQRLWKQRAADRESAMAGWLRRMSRSDWERERWEVAVRTLMERRSQYFYAAGPGGARSQSVD